MSTTIVERIRGRIIEIEIGEVQGLGWVAVGIIAQGVDGEPGMRFDATAESAAEAETRLRSEIEAYFA